MIPRAPYDCPDCGRGVHFFQPSCPSCESTLEWDIPCPECGNPRTSLDGPCPECGATVAPWRVLEAHVLADGEPVTVSKAAVPRPPTAGYSRHLGSVRGQWADFRRLLDEGREFHVREYTNHYELHLDEVGALDSPGMHAVRYTPRVVANTGITVIDGLSTVVSYTGRLVNSLLGGSDEHASHTKKR